MKVVAIDDFLDYLKKNDLVIVSASEFQANKQIELSALRGRLMKKRAIRISDIVKAQLLPYKSKTSVDRWVKNKLTENIHWYRDKAGRIMVLTEAVKDYMQIL